MSKPQKIPKIDRNSPANYFGGRGNTFNFNYYESSTQKGDVVFYFDGLWTLVIVVIIGVIVLIWQGIKNALFVVEMAVDRTKQEVAEVSETVSQIWPYLFGIAVLAIIILTFSYNFLQRHGVIEWFSNFFNHEEDINW